MCGITGFIRNDSHQFDGRSSIENMTDALHHRGPDDSDVWGDAESGVFLGHRRLSILDLSPLGRQPMHSACGRYVVVYNGEVYNYREIREELSSRGYSFKGGSDTEVLLAAFSEWDIVDAVNKFIGMFALALWDKREQKLHLIRDRAGIKPLYYGFADGNFVFASELKALRRAPGFKGDVDRGALSLYFRHNYIPAPYSIYENVCKLEPGTILTFDQARREPVLHRYWDPRHVWLKGEERPFAGTEEEAADELERLIEDAVRLRMVADVPLGAFLSGGIDSSVVVALMQKQSARPIKTFSIGFHEKEYNEAGFAKTVADHLGTDHTELYLTPRDLLDVVPDIPRYWDEPFADSSQIPTYCVSKLARRDVTVSLSGDGGDELFAGYERYFWMARWKTVSRIPLPARRLAAKVLKRLPASAFQLFGSMGPKLRWRLDLLRMEHFAEFYRYFMSHLKHPSEFVIGGHEPVTPFTREQNDIPQDHFRKMTFWDFISYLPDDILTKVDRASMAVSLEARVPLLDHRVVEFAARLPTGMKVKGATGKHVLRNILYRHVPADLVDRPKKGFGVPIDHWLKNELRDWAEALLDRQRLHEEGYVDPAAVRNMWKDYLDGQNNWHYYLWDILMFQAWLDSREN